MGGFLRRSSIIWAKPWSERPSALGAFDDGLHWFRSFSRSFHPAFQKSSKKCLHGCVDTRNISTAEKCGGVSSVGESAGLSRQRSRVRVPYIPPFYEYCPARRAFSFSSYYHASIARPFVRPHLPYYFAHLARFAISGNLATRQSVFSSRERTALQYIG